MTKVKENIYKTYTVTLANAKTAFGMDASESFVSIQLISDGVEVVSNIVAGTQETRRTYVMAYNDVKTALSFVAGEEIDSVLLADTVTIVSRRRTL